MPCISGSLAQSCHSRTRKWESLLIFIKEEMGWGKNGCWGGKCWICKKSEGLSTVMRGRLLKHGSNEDVDHGIKMRILKWDRFYSPESVGRYAWVSECVSVWVSPWTIDIILLYFIWSVRWGCHAGGLALNKGFASEQRKRHKRSKWTNRISLEEAGINEVKK